MKLQQQLARHFREVFFGGNWTAVNLKETLAGVNLEQATRQVHDLNTIAKLVFHIHYYVSAILKVLQGNTLDASDKYSFTLPVLNGEEDWQQLLSGVWQDAEQFAKLVEQLPGEKLGETFADEKYGNYYRNISGVIEHTHYHLGQIVVLKKLHSYSV